MSAGPDALGVAQMGIHTLLNVQSVQRYAVVVDFLAAVVHLHLVWKHIHGRLLDHLHSYPCVGCMLVFIENCDGLLTSTFGVLTFNLISASVSSDDAKIEYV